MQITDSTCVKFITHIKTIFGTVLLRHVMSRPVDLLIGCCVLVEGADWRFPFLVRLEEEKKGNTVTMSVMLI